MIFKEVNSLRKLCVDTSDRLSLFFGFSGKSYFSIRELLQENGQYDESIYLYLPLHY